MGNIEGYPFFNPFIPLVCIFSCFVPANKIPESIKLCYIKPVHKMGQPLHADCIAQKIYDELCKLDVHQYKGNYKDVVVVAPETMYPFCLNKHMDHVQLWASALSRNTHFLLGSQRKEESGNEVRYFQSVFWLHKGLIMQSYDKKHCVPFVEMIPKKWKNVGWARGLFLQEKGEFSVACNRENDYFCISNKLTVIPKMCSELFVESHVVLPKLQSVTDDHQTIIFFFVNDSWFMEYFRRVLQVVGRLRSFEYSLPVLYISH